MSRAKLLELNTREIKPIPKGKRKNVYTNGIDDNYPERVDLIINNSVTAKMACNKMASFIIGHGFKNEPLNELVVNHKKGYTSYDILVMIANSISRQKGAYVHVNYNGMLKTESIDVLPYKNCRIEKEDDLDNRGKVYYSKKWGDSDYYFNKSIEKDKWFYPFSSSEKVIKAQFKEEKILFDEKSEINAHQFRGQVLFINLEPENIYPLSFVDAAYNDADSEYHSSIHRNNTIKNGFSDKQVLVVRGGSDKEDESGIEKAVVDMLGSNGSNIAMYTVPPGDDDLSKEIHVENLGSEIKSERYKYFDEINESKILHCFENIPRTLVGVRFRFVWRWRGQNERIEIKL